jgi:transcriptional regulator with XRE-family HTH domain
MFDSEFILTTPDEVTRTLSGRLKKRRLEKGLTRAGLQSLTGVPKASIARFEMTSKVSLESFVKIAMALGYVEELERLFSEPKFGTLEEMELIKKNADRKRGSRKI